MIISCIGYSCLVLCAFESNEACILISSFNRDRFAQQIPSRLKNSISYFQFHHSCLYCTLSFCRCTTGDNPFHGKNWKMTQQKLTLIEWITMSHSVKKQEPNANNHYDQMCTTWTVWTPNRNFITSHRLRRRWMENCWFHYQSCIWCVPVLSDRRRPRWFSQIWNSAGLGHLSMKFLIEIRAAMSQ